MDKKNIIAKFEGESEFKFLIEKSLPLPEFEKEGKLIIGGVASSSNVDHDQERMHPNALERMANIINEKSVPLRIEHQKGEEAIVGKVVEGDVDERGNLNIKAELNSDDPRAVKIYDAMKSGTRLGFSVGGRVKSAVREMVESLGKKVRTFYDVILDEVSLTPRPANFDAYAVAKSIAGTEGEADKFRFGSFYRDFLSENPKLDYLGMIEKSIPDSKWIKVDQSNTNDNFMNKLFGKEVVKNDVTDAPGFATKEAEDTETKPESKEEEMATKSFVRNVVKTEMKPLIDLLQGIRKDIAAVDADGSADDEEQPVKEKAETLDSDVNSDQTARQTGKKKDAMDMEAEDQTQPKEDKTEMATKSISPYRKTAEQLLGMAKRLLRKEEREGQEDTVGNGENETGREDGKVDPAVDATAHDQEEPVSVKSKATKKNVRKTGLAVGTGTEENTGAKEQVNPDQKTEVDEDVTTAKSNRKLAFELMKTARALIRKDTFIPDSSETGNDHTKNTDSNLKEFETAKDTLEPTETESTGSHTDSNLKEFDTAKTSDSSESDSESEGRFDMADDEESLVATHDIPDSSEKTNSYGDEYKVTGKTRKSAPIDLLVAHISKTMDDMKALIEKDHHRMIGFESQFVDNIQRNEEVQKSIKELMAIPGPKKSVSMGVPYMFTKEGKRYPLVRVGGESGGEIAKSQAKEGETFKDFWKREKSSDFDNVR